MSLFTFLIFIGVGLKSITIIFWFKIITSTIGVIFHKNLKAKEIFFYMNIGIGKKELITFSLFLDFILWFIGLIILIKI